jgi:hypothetical protein
MQNLYRVDYAFFKKIDYTECEEMIFREGGREERVVII